MSENGRRRAAWSGRRSGGLAGLLGAIGLLAGCAAGKPAAEIPEVVAERTQREQVEAAHRQLDTAHQELLAERQQLLAEDQRLRAEYQRLLAEHQQIQAEHQQLVPENRRLQAERQRLVAEQQQLLAEHQRLQAEYQPLVAENRRLQAERQQLVADRQQLEAEHQRLQAERQQLQDGHQRLLAEHQRLQAEHQRLQAEHQRLVREHRAAQEAAKRQAAAVSSEEEVARLRLSLLERDAQIKLLTQKLDAVILEVVRTLAKLRSLESKAEAATNLAEAEVALKMLERSSAGREKPPEVAQAEQLLKLGAQEFRKDNYSGALYLSTQAKSLVKGSQPGPVSGESAPRLEGEVAFALPLSLKVVARGEAREGPGPGFKVAFVVPGGAPVTAQSYKGLWVRVRDGEGRSGWLRHNLVGQR